MFSPFGVRQPRSLPDGRSANGKLDVVFTIDEGEDGIKA